LDRCQTRLPPWQVTGETNEELAESFLNQMLEGGYARKL